MGRMIWAAVLLAMVACSDDGLGSPCKPTVPCDADGANCGFNVSETYVSEHATDCPHNQACIVHHLDNGTDGALRADPNVVCTSSNSPSGCVTEEAIERSMFCSCRCAREGTEDRSGLCTCGEGFACATVGGGSNWYCVKQ
jgi:hypothetical protein